MATVVITLLVTTRFYVSKMDADIEERRRDRISRREKRWSMNSQRLEQIVAELMRPIGDLRRSFDTDLSALLEEYLTEAGLHALEAEGSPGSPGGAGAGAMAGAAGAPNFPELALLLQQSANIYGRKVDFLYQHVLAVSESLQLSTTELSQSPAEAGAGAGAEAAAGGARRRRRASALGWARVPLEPCAAAAREPAPRPPPTLPRLFAELEPRAPGPADVPLRDYAGEPVGLLQDFHVAWRLHGGLLVDELECGAEEPGTLRAIPLAELQAAIEACAPPSPPPPARLACSTPLPPEDPPPLSPLPEPATPLPVQAAPAPEQATPRRKRKLGDLYEDGAGKLYLTPELRLFLRQEREFSVPGAWLARVVAERRASLLAARASVAPPLTEFHGFDDLDKSLDADIGGFLGFERSSVTEREVSLVLSRLAEAAAESEDDGYFEGSSLGSEGSARLESPPPPPPAPSPDAGAWAAWALWAAGVARRAAAGEARAPDVRALGGAVLRALPGPAGDAGHAGAGATPFRAVLAAAAADDADVSRLFLATLFLANAGNVEVVAGPPLSLGEFGLRLRSRDERRYCAAAAGDPAFLAR